MLHGNGFAHHAASPISRYAITAHFPQLPLTCLDSGKPLSKLPDNLSVLANAPAADLYVKLAQQSKQSVHRLRITKGSDGSSVPNIRDVSIQSTGLRDQSTIYVKDLGPQIAWRTVFVVEYLGPLLIHPLFYAMRPYIYSSAPSHASLLQTLFFILISLHFLKREVETLFVHHFSAATMPARNIVKNGFHYWVLAGLNMAVWIYAPSSPAVKRPKSLLVYSGLPLYVVGELGNLYTHLVLRGLRSKGGKERGIPKGVGFDLVTCPNYLTEIISWIGMYLVSGMSLSVLLFIVVGTAQMMSWAKQKEAKYRKEFGDKYKRKRYVVLPGVW